MTDWREVGRGIYESWREDQRIEREEAQNDADELAAIRDMLEPVLSQIDGAKPWRSTGNLVYQVLEAWHGGEPWPEGVKPPWEV